MTTDEIMQTIDAKREEQRKLIRELRGAPKHIINDIDPRLTVLHLEIEGLKVRLFQMNGGKVDN